MDIEADLKRTLANITEQVPHEQEPEEATLARIAALLEGFVIRHRDDLNFEHFPLPTGSEDALSSYELHGDERSGVTLYVNAIRGGVDSVIHDHGTWAVIVGIAGSEHNRIYRYDAEQGELSLEEDVTVREGRPLVLSAGRYHSIHTNPEQPALQLHLYGQPIDRIDGRRLIDPQSGEVVYLGKPPAEPRG